MSVELFLQNKLLVSLFSVDQNAIVVSCDRLAQKVKSPPKRIQILSNFFIRKRSPSEKWPGWCSSEWTLIWTPYPNITTLMLVQGGIFGENLPMLSRYI